MEYYSARLLILSLRESDELISECVCDYSFYVFMAKDYEDAMNRAVQLGKEQEACFKNNAGEAVRWVFKSVEIITRLGEDIGGVEVGSLMDIYKFESPTPANISINPAESEPLLN